MAAMRALLRRKRRGALNVLPTVCLFAVSPAHYGAAHCVRFLPVQEWIKKKAFTHLRRLADQAGR